MFEVDARFLASERKEFEDNWQSKVSAWAERVYECFKLKGNLAYIPRIYVTPFYAYDESPMRLNIGGSVRTAKYVVRQVATTSVDAENPEEKWAIYILYNLIKIATPKTNTANIAHELLHYYHRPRKPMALTLQEFSSMVGKSEVEIYYMKEREVKQAEDFFEEPVRSMILDMEKEKSQLGTGKKYTEGAEEVKGSEFLGRVLGEQRARDFLDKLLRHSPELT